MVLDPYGGELHTGVDGSSDGAAKGIPRHVVEPFEKLLTAVLVEVFSGAIVEVWVEFVDDGSFGETEVESVIQWWVGDNFDFQKYRIMVLD